MICFAPTNKKVMRDNVFASLERANSIRLELSGPDPVNFSALLDI
jgi:hypothetical protein